MRQLKPPHSGASSLAERLAVGALVLGGICLVSTNEDPIQGAVILAVAVISAGLNGTFDALISVTVHSFLLLLLGWR